MMCPWVSYKIPNTGHRPLYLLNLKFNKTDISGSLRHMGVGIATLISFSGNTTVKLRL
jgi:hypothetical protein